MVRLEQHWAAGTNPPPPHSLHPLLRTKPLMHVSKALNWGEWERADPSLAVFKLMPPTSAPFGVTRTNSADPQLLEARTGLREIPGLHLGLTK